MFSSKTLVASVLLASILGLSAGMGHDENDDGRLAETLVNSDNSNAFETTTIDGMDQSTDADDGPGETAAETDTDHTNESGEYLPETGDTTPPGLSEIEVLKNCAHPESGISCPNGFLYELDGVTSMACSLDYPNSPIFCSEKVCCKEPAPAVPLTLTCGEYIKCPVGYKTTSKEACSSVMGLAASCSDNFCCRPIENNSPQLVNCSDPAIGVVCVDEYTGGPGRVSTALCIADSDIATWNRCGEKYCCDHEPIEFHTCADYSTCPFGYKVSPKQECSSDIGSETRCSDEFCCVSGQSEYLVPCTRPNSGVGCPYGYAFASNGFWPKSCLTNDSTHSIYCDADYCCNSEPISVITCKDFTECTNGYKTTANEPCTPSPSLAATCSVKFCCK